MLIQSLPCLDAHLMLTGRHPHFPHFIDEEPVAERAGKADPRSRD